MIITEDEFEARYLPLELYEEGIRLEDYDEDPQSAFLAAIDDHYIWSHVGSGDEEGFEPGRDGYGKHATVVSTIPWSEEDRDKGLFVKFDEEPARDPRGHLSRPA